MVAGVAVSLPRFSPPQRECARARCEGPAGAEEAQSGEGLGDALVRMAQAVAAFLTGLTDAEAGAVCAFRQAPEPIRATLGFLRLLEHLLVLIGLLAARVVVRAVRRIGRASIL
jgi:hypothetical protein